MNNLSKTLDQALSDWKQWLPDEQPQLVATLNEGLSHQSYLIASGGRDCVLRINNPHSQNLALSLPREEKLLRLAQDKNLGAKLIHFCPHYLVTEYVAAEAWMLEYSSDEQLAQLAEHLKRIHKLDSEDNFDLISHCENYWQNIQDPTPEQHALNMKCFALLKESLQQSPQRCLCHNDFTGENLLKVETGFITLDWEYAGNNHPDFDLATLIEFSSLDTEQMNTLLNYYWGQITPVRLDNLKAFRIIVRYVQWLWLLQQPNFKTQSDNSYQKILQKLSTQ